MALTRAWLRSLDLVEIPARQHLARVHDHQPVGQRGGELGVVGHGDDRAPPRLLVTDDLVDPVRHAVVYGQGRLVHEDEGQARS